ncbi:MAG TPA: DinB family protein [Terriglobales bacterium]|nr:DinB family protein [Terriglobales bacterium]
MDKMKYALACCFLLLFGVSAFSQTDSNDHKSVADVFNASLSSAEREFVSAAEAMPSDKYSFAPTNGEFKGVRTFALQVRHVASANYEFASVILGEKNPVEMGSQENGSDALKSKDEIVKYLKDSFVYLHKALGSLNEGNLVTPIKSPWGKGTITRLQIAILSESHPFDHYGQMVEYLRMNGTIPPASRR